MKKLLLLIIISIFLSNCIYYDPINEPPQSDFVYQLNTIDKCVDLRYDGIEESDLKYEWKMTGFPENSKLKELTYPFKGSQENEYKENRFCPDIPGDYEVSLKVTDKYNADDTKSKKIVIQNQTPSAIIKVDEKNYVTGNTIILNAEDSFDPDETQLTYDWSFKQLPENSNLFSENIIKEGFLATFIPDVSGLYIIKLSVSDINKDSASSYLSMFVYENKPPQILKTNPDNNISFISLKKDDEIIVSVTAIDDSTPFIDLKYKWEILLNGENTNQEYSGYEYDLNGIDYSLGDLIDLKLTITDENNLTTEIIWHFLVIL